MLNTAKYSGFTLIELLIGLALVAILLFLAVPAFTGMIQSARIKAAASGFAAGLQMARAQAIARNGVVLFCPDATAWVVGTGTNCATAIDSKPMGESEGVTVTPGLGSFSNVSFNGFGRPTSPTSETYDFSVSGAASGVRSLRVVLSAGGQIRVCDPAVVTAGDTRQC